MKACIDCGNPASAKEYNTTQCSNCYTKYKQALRVIRSQFKSKYGNWICGRCGRAHTGTRNFCWECGDSKNNASWADGKDRPLQDSTVNQNLV